MAIAKELRTKVVRVDKFGQVEICGYVGRDQVIGFYVGDPKIPGRIRNSMFSFPIGDEKSLERKLGLFARAFKMAKAESRRQKRAKK